MGWARPGGVVGFEFRSLARSHGTLLIWDYNSVTAFHSGRVDYTVFAVVQEHQKIREIGHTSMQTDGMLMTLQWLNQEDCVIDSTSVNQCLGEETVAIIAREKSSPCKDGGDECCLKGVPACSLEWCVKCQHGG